MTSCKQAARLVSLSFERRLTPGEYVTMRLHLSMCKTCNYYRKQVRSLRSVFAKHEEVLENTPPSECECLSEETKKRMRQKLNLK